MNYTHNYYKLNNLIYSTIRKSKKPDQKEGKVENEVVKKKFKHYSRILSVESVKLPEIPTGFLIMDCIYPGSNIQSRKDCYNLFQSFYQIKINFDVQKWFLFILMKSPIKIESEALNNFVVEVKNLG